MKRLIIGLIIGVMAFSQVVATTFDFDKLKKGFQGFSTDFASGLAYNSTVGLNWADSYIGSFPHFGVGAVAGATFIPSEVPKKVLTETMGVSIPASLDQYLSLGFPIPAVALEGRVGGLFLPFDIGVKWASTQAVALSAFLPSNLTVDYELVGADIRLQLIEESIIIPGISIGGGIQRVSGGLGFKGLLGGDQQITIPAPVSKTISFSDPSINFKWETTVVDFKIQASKNLFIITPYVGLGTSLGFSKAGGGLSSSTTKIDGVEVSQSTMDDLLEKMKAANQTIPAFDTSGFTVSGDSTGWSFRAFGGFSLNLLILKLDVTGMYDITSDSPGVSVGFRAQL